MNMQEVRTIAKERGLKSGNMKKIDLIRMIQAQEGNFACFATAAEGLCDQGGCLWREDCFEAAKKAAG